MCGVMKVVPPIVTENNSSAGNVSETNVVEASGDGNRRKREVGDVGEGSGDVESNNAEKTITIVDKSECDESKRYLFYNSCSPNVFYVYI